MFSAASKTDNVSAEANYIESVFSTYLYTGNGSTLAINNGIDLSTYGGLVWVKRRDATIAHGLWDTARGVGTGTSNATNKALATNSTSAEGLGDLYPGEDIDYLSAFATNGFTVKSNALGGRAIADGNGGTYVSWTFRKQPKFFDVVTYTGNGANRTIAHNLGSVPGCIIVKRTDTTGAWHVYHRSLANTEYMVLNTTAAKATDPLVWNSTTPTSTVFSVGTIAAVNANGGTYVAYLFAHDAGGFGASGNDNVISCGSFTGDGSGNVTVSLGYEPQWLLVKNISVTGNWQLIDNMRGFPVTSAGTNRLSANLANSEANDGQNYFFPTATGFGSSTGTLSPSNQYIYIAIRRGPMKTPTSGTSVLALNTRTGNSSTSTVSNLSFPPDLVWTDTRSNDEGAYMFDKLRGTLLGLRNFGPDAEVNDPQYLQTFGQTGFTYGSNGSINSSNRTYIDWCMRRAPSFFDEVCYSGTGSNTTQTHNLGVTPELIIVKRRGATSAWPVYSAALANTEYLVLNTTAAKATGATYWNSTTPTSTVFSLGTAADVNASGSTGTYVAYLFASCPGVSKVGTYSGTGGTQTISCGFAARYVLIKRTDSTGNWWVWDTGRGMVAGTDPRLPINAALGETNANWVYTDASGFQIVTTDASVNASGGSYIFLAVA